MKDKGRPPPPTSAPPTDPDALIGMVDRNGETVVDADGKPVLVRLGDLMGPPPDMTPDEIARHAAETRGRRKIKRRLGRTLRIYKVEIAELGPDDLEPPSVSPAG